MFRNSFKPVATAAFVLVTSLGALSAQAAPSVYAGASIGAPRFEEGIQGSSGHGDGVSGKVFGGVDVTPNFAVEAGVADLGRADATGGHVDARAAYLDAVGKAPVTDKVTLLGSIGIAHVDVDTPQADGNGNGLKLGVGAEYAITNNVALRGEVERYRPSVFGDKPNIDQYTVGVRYGF